MAKARTRYECTACGAEYLKWNGQCTNCGAWNTIEEALPEIRPAARTGGSGNARRTAGLSAQSIHPMLNARVCGIAAAVVGTMLAIVAPVGGFEEFLYLIGSVFAPMAALVIADYFFMLALWLNKEDGVPEIPFESRNY